MTVIAAIYPAKARIEDPMGQHAYVAVREFVITLDPDMTREQMADHVAMNVRQAVLNAPDAD